jgi:hypothetical protein
MRSGADNQGSESGAGDPPLTFFDGFGFTGLFSRPGVPEFLFTQDPAEQAEADKRKAFND